MTNQLHSFLPPQNLSIHPALENFPGLSDDQLAALTLSVKSRGIQTPLVIDGDRQVYDGRAMLGIALALELSLVPVVVREEKDVLAYAIESAVNRRQLTRSAIAFLLFEQHPELAIFRNKGGRPKKPAGIPQVSVQPSSFAQLSARYRLDRDYFTQLLAMHNGMSVEEWTELRRIVLFEEASIPRQFAGFSTGAKAGCSRGAVIYASLDAQGLLDGILPRAFSSIRQGFARWGTEIPTDAKAAIEKQWSELLDDAPPELLKIARKKAGHHV
jgi:hypothetical protein